jgi:hypothetical protein
VYQTRHSVLETRHSVFQTRHSMLEPTRARRTDRAGEYQSN